MTIIEGDYKSPDGKDYFYVLIDKRCGFIQFYKNFSCSAAIYKFMEKDYELLRSEIHQIFSVIFIGSSPDLNKIPKKYRSKKFQIL